MVLVLCLSVYFRSQFFTPTSPSFAPFPPLSKVSVCGGVHLKRVLCPPGPQVALQEAQLDQELQEQLGSALQLRLVQESRPSAQVQLLQSAWCVLPAAQLWPRESTQSHCHNFTHTPSCCS